MSYRGQKFTKIVGSVSLEDHAERLVEDEEVPVEQVEEASNILERAAKVLEERAVDRHERTLLSQRARVKSMLRRKATRGELAEVLPAFGRGTPRPWAANVLQAGEYQIRSFA